MAWYKVGTISVTNNSTTVTGVGTAWVGAVLRGEGVVMPNGVLYEIDLVNSGTSITLARPYTGPTTSGQSYAICPIQDYIKLLASQAAELLNAVNDSVAGVFGVGSVSLPSIRTAADPNTGLNLLGGDELSLVTGGVDRFKVGSTGTPSGTASDYLLSRTNHTGTQAIDTVSGLQAALNAKAPASHTHDASSIASGVLADSRLPARLRAVPQVVTDWNSAVGSGWYQGNDAANAPTTGNFIGNVECHHERWVTQVVHAFNTDSAADTKTYRRESSDSNGVAAWGPWYRLRLSEAEQAALRQAWWDNTAVPMSKVTNLQTTLDSLAVASVAQTNVGPAHNELPSNQHLGALAFLDTLGATQVTQHVRDSRPGDVWHEWVSNTQLIKKFHGFDGVIRAITETYA